HTLEDPPQLLLLARGDAAGSERGRGRFQDAAHLVKLDLGLAEEQMADEAGALQEQPGLEAADVSPVALADLQHAQLGQGAHRLAQRVAGQAQLGRQRALLRQPVAGSPGTRDDPFADLVDGLLGDLRGPPRTPAAAGCAGGAQVVGIVGETERPAMRSDVRQPLSTWSGADSALGLTNIGALA